MRLPFFSKHNIGTITIWTPCQYLLHVWENLFPKLIESLTGLRCLNRPRGVPREVPDSAYTTIADAIGATFRDWPPEVVDAIKKARLPKPD